MTEHGVAKRPGERRRRDELRAPLLRLSPAFLLAMCLGCGDGVFHTPTNPQRLGSGKVVQVTSCLLVWGGEHDERHPGDDSFALEYVSPLVASPSEELDREVLEVFELIRPVSEQWGFSKASVAAFSSVERTGKYEIYAFSRSLAPPGPWTFTRASMKVYNTESGRKSD